MEYTFAHCLSVAVLCMLFKIKSNPMHSLSGVLPLPYVPEDVTLGALVAHRRSFVPPHSRTSQCHRTFVFHSEFLWNDLGDPVFNGVGPAHSKNRADDFVLA